MGFYFYFMKVILFKYDSKKYVAQNTQEFNCYTINLQINTQQIILTKKQNLNTVLISFVDLNGTRIKYTVNNFNNINYFNSCLFQINFRNQNQKLLQMTPIVKLKALRHK